MKSIFQLFIFAGLLNLLACSPKTNVGSDVTYSFDCIDQDKIRPNAPTTMEYAPVCGCDGRTYPNPGTAVNNGVTSYTDGTCPCQIERKDQRPCTREYKPVCGCNGETYSNDCAALNAGVTAWEAGTCEENGNGD